MDTWKTPVGIVGTGIMGVGIAQRLVEYGVTATLIGRDSEKFEIIRKKITDNAKLSVRRKRVRQENVGLGLSNLVITAEFEQINNCELVIEAITEDFDAKAALYKSLSPHLSKTACLCTNTSSLSVSSLAIASGLAERFLGLHFMNPAATSQMAELIRQPKVSEEQLSRICSFAKAIGLELVEMEDAPGFIVNRLLMAMIVQAVRLVEEGVATPEAVDLAMRLGCAHPMGPLALADMIGLDLILAEINEMHSRLGAGYSSPGMLKKLVAEGQLGRKSGRGFFNYGK